MTSGNEFSRRSFLSRSAVAGGAVALGGGASSLLASCSSSPSGSAGTPTTGSKPGVGTGTPRRGGTLTVATVAEIDGFFPANNHWDTNGFIYANAIYDPLMAVGADGTIKPYLAKSMTSNSTFDCDAATGSKPGIDDNRSISHDWRAPSDRPGLGDESSNSR